MIETEVLVFSALKDKVGARQIRLDVPKELTGEKLLDVLIQRYPAVEPLRGLLRVAANRRYVRLDEPIDPHAELAVFPPVSGG